MSVDSQVIITYIVEQYQNRYWYHGTVRIAKILAIKTFVAIVTQNMFGGENIGRLSIYTEENQKLVNKPTD